MCKLLTNLGLYPFDPQRVIDKLPQNIDSKSPPPDAFSSEIPSFSESLQKTPTNQKQFSAMMNHLTPWLPSSFQNNVRQLKKASSMTFADRRLLQDSTTELFKANLAKESRKRKRKADDERATYGSAFGRVLTQTMAQTQRLKEEEKAQEILIRKEATRTRKLAAAAKKQAIADNRIKRAAARAAKKTQKDEEDRLKALDREAKGTKKRGRKRKADVNSASQENLPASQPSSALIDLEVLEASVYPDSDAPAPTGAYFGMFNSQSIE